jgi:hypothetical protein
MVAKIYRRDEMGHDEPEFVEELNYEGDDTKPIKDRLRALQLKHSEGERLRLMGGKKRNKNNPEQYINFISYHSDSDYYHIAYYIDAK